MKGKKIIIAVIGCTAGVILSSCQTKEKRLENAQENVVEANDELVDAQRAYKTESENRLHENDVTIENYRTSIKDQKEDTRMAYQHKIDSLEQKNKELRIKLNNYNEKDKDKWESFKREFNHDMDELKDSFKDLSKNNVK